MQNNYQSSFCYASVSKRFIAYFIDLICIAFLSWLIYFIFQIFSFFIGILGWADFISRNWYFFVFPIVILVSYFYFTLFPSSSFSSTLGQLLLKIKQVDQNGNSLTFGKANIKFFATILSKIFYIGYIFVFFNVYHQTFHEMLTNTYLVER